MSEEVPISEKPRSDKPRNWWIMFPISGLEITDELPDLESCMFGDATIISREHTKLLAEKWANAHQPEDKGIPYMLTHFPLKEWHSQIAVRRTGILHDEFKRGEQSELGLKAVQRAEEISALLSIAFLSMNKETPGLLKHIQETRDTLTALDFDDGGLMLTGGGGRGYTIRENWKIVKLTRLELLAVLRREPLTILTKSILDHSFLSKTTRRSVCESAMRVSESLHAARPSSQLLGAVTAIEILLQDQAEGYKGLERRLNALLGNSAGTSFSVPEILKARHEYVHMGIDLNNSHIAAKAICLSICALLVFASVATLHSSKVAVLRYLNMIFLGELHGPIHFRHAGELLSLSGLGPWHRSSLVQLQTLARFGYGLVLPPFPLAQLAAQPRTASSVPSQYSVAPHSCRALYRPSAYSLELKSAPNCHIHADQRPLIDRNRLPDAATHLAVVRAVLG